MRFIRMGSFLLAAAGVATPQSVISVRAGVVNAFEGAVFIGGQPVSSKFGTYPRLREGSDLYTQDGRAELQLSPDVFLRVGNDSAVRMVSSSLADTQIRILNGSAIFDSGNAHSPSPVTLLAGDAQIRIEAPSRMRIDADPPQLRVEKGEARVSQNGTEITVRADQLLPLTAQSVIRRMTNGNDDDLELWSQQRNRMIFLSLSTSQSLLDPGLDPDPTAPADLSAWLGYMPLSGVLPVTGMYSGVQPTLGYTYPYPGAYSGPYSYYGVPVYGLSYYGMRLTYPRTFTSFRPVYSAPSFRAPLGPARGFIPMQSRPVVVRPMAPHVGVHR